MTKVVLISCVKSKRTVASSAKDLYVSNLFRKMREYAELHADRWYILSAKYGLLAPDDIVEPYEMTLNDMHVSERRAWASRTALQLGSIVHAGDIVSILAGQRYIEGLIGPLHQMGALVEIPLEGLSFGRRLAWLARHI